MTFRFVLRALILPTLVYGLVGLVAAYFVWHGVNGQRGLKAGVEYEQRIAELRTELAGLAAERGQWERRIALIRGEAIDADLLEEEARIGLGRVHRNDLVILLPPPDAPAAGR
jgi:cell division protein FtsB